MLILVAVDNVVDQLTKWNLRFVPHYSVDNNQVYICTQLQGYHCTV